MFGPLEPDVLIAGAGPVGLFAALCATRNDLHPLILDGEARVAARSYATALHPASLRLLAEQDVWPENDAHGLRVERVAFYEGPERRAEVSFDDLDEDYPYLLVLPQSHFESLLERTLTEREIRVRWRHRLSDWRSENDRSCAEVEELDEVSGGYALRTADRRVVRHGTVKPRWIIGADGHRSTVRERLDIAFEVAGATEIFAVFEFDHDGTLPPEVRVVMDATSTNVLWPMPGRRCRWGFQVTGAGEDYEDLRYKSRLGVQIGRDSFPFLSEEVLDELIRARAPWFDHGRGDVHWSVLARFERRLVERFGQDHVWLCGDAGHLTGPVGVHGMNVGLREAHDLVEAITRIEREGALPEILATWSDERRLEWMRLQGRAGKLRDNGLGNAWVVEHAARILPCMPGSGEHLDALLRQIGLRAPWMEEAVL